MNFWNNGAIRKGVALLWLILVVFAGSYLSWRLYEGINFRADLMALVPREEKNPAIAKANDSVIGALSKRIVLLVGHQDRGHARAAAAEISRALSSAGLLEVSVGGLDSQKLKQIGAMYFPFRHGLLSEEDRRLLQQGKAQNIVERSLAQVFGVGGMASAGMLKSDPFLLMPRFLIDLPVPMSNLTLDEGMLSVHDGDKTWVLVSGKLKGEPYALDVQKNFSRVLDGAVAARQQADPGLTVLRTGALFYAKSGAETAMNETSAIGFVSIAFTVLLLIAAFRSFYPLFMSLLVIAVGMAMALSFSLWFWGEIHVIALLFGVSLIGVTVDYSLQYCSEIYVPDGGGARQRMNNVFAGISLGGATTVVGYTTLLLAPFPGLRQIALFSVAGLLAAWLTVVLWLPFLDKMKRPARGLPVSEGIKRFLNFWERKSYRWPRIVFLSLLAGLCLLGALRFHTDDNVRKLQSLSAPLVAQQAAIQKRVGTTTANQFFVIQAASDEAALRKEEVLADRLRPLMASGGLGGFQSLSSYVPSLARQAENRHLLIERLYKPYLAKQVSALGMSVMPEMPPENAPGLTLDKMTGLKGSLDFLSVLRPDRTAEGIVHVVTLEGVKNTSNLAQAADGLDGVRLVDPTHDFTLLFGKYRIRAVILLVLSAALMFPLLLMRYGFKKSLAIVFPPLLAVTMTPFLCGLIGGTFTFFDAIALVLILSMGLDYTVFFAETTAKRKTTTMFAILISACATIMSFGFLAFSSVTAVHNFGMTMLIGVFLSLVFVPMTRGGFHEIRAE